MVRVHESSRIFPLDISSGHSSDILQENSQESGDHLYSKH